MKYQVKRVKGAQADMARRLGLVKIAKSSAKDLFELGVPLVLVGNKVNDHHFFGGWHLAMDVDSQRYLREDESFDSLVNNWSHYNENPETGKAAFFVDKKHIGGKGGVGGGKRRHAKQWKLVTARKGEVLGKERAPSARLALRQHRAKGHGTTGVAAVRAGGKRRHALKQPSVGKLARELNSMLRD